MRNFLRRLNDAPFAAIVWLFTIDSQIRLALVRRELAQVRKQREVS